MDERRAEIYNDSFEVCMRNPCFLPRFYELFLESSPAVAEKFAKTDLARQSRILKKSLYTLTLASIGTADSAREIDRLGKGHGRNGLNIEPWLYDLWLECLLRAVSEFDPAWSKEVDRSWRQTFGPHLDRLKRYSSAEDHTGG